MFLKKCMLAPVRSDRSASPGEYTVIGGRPVLRSRGGTLSFLWSLLCLQRGHRGEPPAWTRGSGARQPALKPQPCCSSAERPR